MYRIQSLYLLLSVIINIGIAVFSDIKEDEILNVSGLSLFSINLIWLVANTGATLNFLEIFSFKNRNNQYQTVKFNNIIYSIFIIYVTVIAIFNNFHQLIILILGLILSLALCLLATKNIKKDMDLLKSSDRIR
tara:strand:- start:427 stop:828 length:402 start_codon:yes stop_codon:yes gene_type:complete